MSDHDPAEAYQRDRSCRVKGCQEPATVVVPARFRFPSTDHADPSGLAAVNMTFVFCKGHAADSIQAIRDQQGRVGARSADGAGVRAFQRFLHPHERGQRDTDGS